MKKKKIVYGIRGMMEYQTVVRIGRNSVKILFSEGSVSGTGINPARYATSNFVVQQAIEQCPDFKRGLIKKIREYELDEELVFERPKAKAPADPGLSPDGSGAETATTEASDLISATASTQKKSGVEEPSGAEACLSPGGSGAETATPSVEVNVDEAKASEAKASETEAGEAEASEAEAGEALRVMEFACKDDAKDYLEENFHAVRSKLKTRNDIVDLGRANGLDIKFAD